MVARSCRRKLESCDSSLEKFWTILKQHQSVIKCNFIRLFVNLTFPWHRTYHGVCDLFLSEFAREVRSEEAFVKSLLKRPFVERTILCKWYNLSLRYFYKSKKKLSERIWLRMGYWCIGSTRRGPQVILVWEKIGLVKKWTLVSQHSYENNQYFIF